MQITHASQTGNLNSQQSHASGQGNLIAGNPFFGLIQGLLAKSGGEATVSLQTQLPTQEQALDPKAFEALSSTLAQVTESLSAQAGLDQSLTVNAGDISGEQNLDISTILLLDGQFLGKEDGLLDRISAELAALQKDGQAGGVLFNLTPAQMAQLQVELVEASESGTMPVLPDGMEMFIAIVAPDADNEELAAIKLLPFARLVQGGDEEGNTAQLNDLLERVEKRNFDDLLAIRSAEEKFSALLRNAAGLNAQVNNAANGTSGASANPANPASPALGGEAGLLPKANNGKPPVDFSKPDVAQNTGATGGVKASDSVSGGAPTNPNAQTPMGAVEGLPYPEGSFLSSMGLSDEALGSFGLNGTSSSNSALSGLQNLTNPTTQARHASQPHPGTALVAASLRQASTPGANRVITLQLDPPELGRVEVRMVFGHDKTLKTKVISEKPEAHFMLQRDAQVLERAMQESGFEADGSSLSFELAQDGEGFNHDGRHDGTRNAAGQGGQTDDEELVINTQMNWHVDPETGHMHYNILV
jgi:flagellar hook-length control protein FliK